MNAGIDFGCSLTKAVWVDEELQYASTARKSWEEITAKLKADGVKDVFVTGIGKQTGLEDFIVYEQEGDKIANEIEVQAKGVQRMLDRKGWKIDEFLLVSIGTGVSYASVTRESIQRFCVGSPFGGGFIYGLSQLLGVPKSTYVDIINAYHYDTEIASFDLRIQDKLPETADMLMGKWVIALFGKVPEGLKTADFETREYYSIYESIINCVAVNTVRDLIMISNAKDFPNHKDVVFIGSTLEHNPLLPHYLSKYAKVIGKDPFVPDKGEFALAYGAFNQLGSQQWGRKESQQ